MPEDYPPTISDTYHKNGRLRDIWEHTYAPHSIAFAVGTVTLALISKHYELLAASVMGAGMAAKEISEV